MLAAKFSKGLATLGGGTGYARYNAIVLIRQYSSNRPPKKRPDFIWSYRDLFLNYLRPCRHDNFRTNNRTKDSGYIKDSD